MKRFFYFYVILQTCTLPGAEGLPETLFKTVLKARYTLRFMLYINFYVVNRISFNSEVLNHYLRMFYIGLKNTDISFHTFYFILLFFILDLFSAFIKQFILELKL